MLAPAAWRALRSLAYFRVFSLINHSVNVLYLTTATLFSSMALFSNISMDQLLSTWAANGGPSEDEKVAYLNAASDELEDDEMVEKFKENVNQAATWANDIDASFDKVGRTFTDLVNKYGSVLPDINNFKNEWTGYNNVGSASFPLNALYLPTCRQNWIDYLSLSRDVASENVGILKRESNSLSCFLYVTARRFV